MTDTFALDREVIHGRTLTAVIGTAFFIIATALGAYVRIPVPGTPVPITLQTFFVVLSGAVMGRKLGLLSQAGYLFLGAAGLPVFQGYACGAAHIFGPTGGYLIGFLAASFIAGKILKDSSAGIFKTVAAFTAGNAALYTFGILWLMAIYRITLISAITIGVLPFLAAEAVKILAAAALYQKISRRSEKIFPR